MFPILQKGYLNCLMNDRHIEGEIELNQTTVSATG